MLNCAATCRSRDKKPCDNKVINVLGTSLAKFAEEYSKPCSLNEEMIVSGYKNMTIDIDALNMTKNLTTGIKMPP